MRRLTGLDALRGIAALCIAFHHLCDWFGLHFQTASLVFAVDLFFVISGFVMTRTYEVRLSDGTLSPPQFIKLRYARLWFPLALGAVIGFAGRVVWPGLSADLVASAVAVLLFLPAPWSKFGPFGLNLPAWSLFVEIVCNGLHSAVLAKRSNVFLLALLVPSMTAFLAADQITSTLHLGDTAAYTLQIIPRGIAAYVVGMLLFRTFGDRPLHESQISAFAGLLFMPLALWFGHLLPKPLPAALIVLIVAPMSIRLSLSLAAYAWARWLGLFSYPLYATHVPIIDTLNSLGPVGTAAVALVVAGLVTVFHEARRGKGNATSRLLTSPASG